MLPPLDPVRSDTVLPTKTSVVVIGGGIIGASTALFLARKGIPVVLCEKGQIGAEQSGRNWGWTRVMGRDLAEIPLGLESLRWWRQMDALVGGSTGFTQCGIVYLCETKQELERQEAWLDMARPFQVTSTILGPSEIDAVMPGAARPFAGALHTPSDGRAEPQKAAPAIARAIQAAGGQVFTHCAVRGVETKAGRISGVVTELGRIDCDTVVLAGGAWSRLFTGNMRRSGIGTMDLPILKVLGSVFATQPMSGLPEVSAGNDTWAFRKRADGGYTVARRNASITDITPDSFRLLAKFAGSYRGAFHELRLRIGKRFLTEWRTPNHWSLDETSPFETVRVLDPVPHDGVIKEARDALAKSFPGFADMREAYRWGGLMDVTPDAVPIIDQVPDVPGFFLATGFSGHGFGIGPGAGKLMADMVQGDTPAVDPAPYRMGRFS